MIEFTIADEADQQFATILNGRRVTMRLRYNVTTDRWSFDLSIDDEPVLHGRRIVTGVDLLAPFDFGLGALFAVPIDSNNPGRVELPRGSVRLYHATDAEIAAALA
jgi:hypothetical protein